MSDPFSSPRTTEVNLHAGFIWNPHMPGVTRPAPSHFAPTDNPVVFEGAVHNRSQHTFSDRRQPAKNRTIPNPAMSTYSKQPKKPLMAVEETKEKEIRTRKPRVSRR